ncbi:hypothetical protein AVEN_148371-1, partial [Araneus ventricosus]
MSPLSEWSTKNCLRGGALHLRQGSPAHSDTPLALSLHTKDIQYQNQKYVSDQLGRIGYRRGGMRQCSRSEVPNLWYLYPWGYAKSKL